MKPANVIALCLTAIILALLARGHTISIEVRHVIDLTPIVKSAPHK